MNRLLRRGSRLTAVLLVAAAATAQAGVPRDWRGLDEALERARLLDHYMNRVVQPADGWAAYLEKVRYTAESDSLDLETWEVTPRAERDRRRRLAEPWRDRLETTRRTVGRLYDSMVDPGAAPPLGAGVLLEGGAELILVTMGALVNVVGLVPDDAEAWADLGYFAGCAGDTRRQEHALLTFCALHDRMAPREQETFLDRRVRVSLDLAWLARDRGEADLAVARCLTADEWIERDPGAVALADREARLVAALARAEQGRVEAALELAAPLGDLPFRRRNIQTHKSNISPALRDNVVDARFQSVPGYWSLGLPNTFNPAHTAQKGAWEDGQSNWARQWVHALTRLRTGPAEDVLLRLGEPDPLREFPPELNYRYWNDWGRIYEHLGRPAQARRCYALATAYRPYFVYYPVEGRRGFSRLLTTDAEARVYFVGAGIYYTAGDLYAHAAGCLLEWEFTDDAARRAELRRLAEESFTACRNRGIRPTEALAQRGRLRYLAGDLARAEIDLHTAVEEFRAQGRVEADLVLMVGLVHFNGGDYAGALPWLEEYCGLAPDAGIGWRALGLAAVHAGRMAAADSALSRSLVLEPEDPGAWFNRGLVRAKAGRREAALADLTRAATLLPDHPDIIRVKETLEAGPLPDIALTAAPIRIGTDPRAAAAIHRLQRVNLAAEMGTPAVAELLAPEGEDRLAPDALEDAYLRDPSPANRARLARRHLADGRPDLVQDLLVPAWDWGLTDEELLVLLAADRELGETKRAAALVHGLSGTAAGSASPAVWQLAGAVCLEGDLGDQAAQALEHAASLDTASPGEDR